MILQNPFTLTLSSSAAILRRPKIFADSARTSTMRITHRTGSPCARIRRPIEDRGAYS